MQTLTSALQAEEVIMLCKAPLLCSLRQSDIPKHIVGTRPLRDLNVYNCDALSEWPVINDVYITRGNTLNNFIGI
jgi:hypothetical protein